MDRWATDRETGQGPWPGRSAQRRPGPSGNGSMEEVAPQAHWSGQPASHSLLTPALCHVPAGRGGGTGEGGVTLTYTGLPASEAPGLRVRGMATFCKPRSSFQFLTRAVMEIKIGGESELSPRKIRWRTPGASCRSPKQDLSKHNSCPGFPASENPPYCSHYLSLQSSLILQVVSLNLPLSLCIAVPSPGKRTLPSHTCFHIFTLFVSALTEAWTTNLNIFC